MAFAIHKSSSSVADESSTQQHHQGETLRSEIACKAVKDTIGVMMMELKDKVNDKTCRDAINEIAEGLYN